MKVSKRLRATLRVLPQWWRVHRSGGTAVRHLDAHDAAAATRPERILLLRLDGLGDFLLSMPAFRQFRSSFPEASLELLIHPGNIDLALRTGLFDALHPFPFFELKERKEISEQEMLSALADLGLGTFDIVVDMRHYGSTRRLAAAIPAKLRAGFRARGKDEAISLLLPDFDTSPVGRRVHMASRLMSLAVAVTTAFGVRPGVGKNSDFLSGRQARNGSRPNGERLVYINPFSGRLIKDWPISHYATLIKALTRRTGTSVIIFGDSPAELGAKRLMLTSIPGVVDLGADLSFDFMINQLAAADLYIGNDSGTTHLAANLGVPTVAIMSGDVDPEVWRPLGAAVAILKSDVPCAPCGLNALALCPVGHLCMKTIVPEAVLAASDSLLEDSGALKLKF